MYTDLVRVHGAIHRRLDLAQRVAASAEPLVAIAGVAVGGSVALGLADNDSDVEIAVVCHRGNLLRPDERSRLYASVAPGAATELDALGPGTFDSLEVYGIRLEVEVLDIAKLRAGLIAASEPAPDCWRRHPPYGHHGYALISMVHYWRVLSDQTGSLRDLAPHASLSPKLRLQMLKQGSFLKDPHLLYEYERACTRRDSHYALRCRARLVEHYTQMAFAAAGVVYRGDKWLWQFLPGLPLPPAIARGLRDFVQTLDRSTRSTRANAVLAKELYHLLHLEARRVTSALGSTQDSSNR